MTSPASLTLRFATPSDARTLERLARLDSSRPLGGRALVAERDGTPVAAVSLLDGRAVADPFSPTADAVAMLRMRAGQLRGHGARRRARRLAGLRPAVR